MTLNRSENYGILISWILSKFDEISLTTPVYLSCEIKIGWSRSWKLDCILYFVNWRGSSPAKRHCRSFSRSHFSCHCSIIIFGIGNMKSDWLLSSRRVPIRYLFCRLYGQFKTVRLYSLIRVWAGKHHWSLANFQLVYNSILNRAYSGAMRFWTLNAKPWHNNVLFELRTL